MRDYRKTREINGNQNLKCSRCKKFEGFTFKNGCTNSHIVKIGYWVIMHIFDVLWGPFLKVLTRLKCTLKWKKNDKIILNYRVHRAFLTTILLRKVLKIWIIRNLLILQNPEFILFQLCQIGRLYLQEWPQENVKIGYWAIFAHIWWAAMPISVSIRRCVPIYLVSKNEMILNSISWVIAHIVGRWIGRPTAAPYHEKSRLKMSL